MIFPLFSFIVTCLLLGEVIKAVQAIFHSDGIPAEWKKMITLIPKRFNASVPSHFRPINLCTTILYKVCARILVKQLQLIMSRLINPK